MGNRPKIGAAMAAAFGQIGVFDEHDRQIPELQISWPRLWAEHAERLGYDPQGVVFELPGLGGLKILRHPDGGWTYEPSPYKPEDR